MKSNINHTLIDAKQMGNLLDGDFIDKEIWGR